MCKERIKRLFKKRVSTVSKVETAKPQPRKWWQFPVRVIGTRRFGPNMPKTQPCPTCHAAAKRGAKTAGEAKYGFRCGEVFFVRASWRAVQY